MREQPAGLALLEIAAETLRNEILPNLPEQSKYAGLMVLNALSIAGRQLTLDESLLSSERELLKALLKETQDEEDVRAHVARLERELARRTRAGAYDDDGIGQRVLWQITLQRVRESAPRYLESEGIE